MEKTIKTIDCTPTWAFATSVYIRSIAQNGMNATDAIEDLMCLARQVDAHQQADNDFKAMDAIGQTCSLIQESYDNIGDAYHICMNKGINADLLEAIQSVENALANLHNKFQAIR